MDELMSTTLMHGVLPPNQEGTLAISQLEGGFIPLLHQTKKYQHNYSSQN